MNGVEHSNQKTQHSLLLPYRSRTHPQVVEPEHQSIGHRFQPQHQRHEWTLVHHAGYLRMSPRSCREQCSLQEWMRQRRLVHPGRSRDNIDGVRISDREEMIGKDQPNNCKPDLFLAVIRMSGSNTLSKKPSDRFRQGTGTTQSF